MIKNTIIFILIFIIILTIYSYYSLCNSMTNYQKDRLDTILAKEKIVNSKEISLNKLNSISSELDIYKTAFNKITNILSNLNNSKLIDEIMHITVPPNLKKVVTGLSEQPVIKSDGIIPLSDPPDIQRISNQGLSANGVNIINPPQINTTEQVNSMKSALSLTNNTLKVL